VTGMIFAAVLLGIYILFLLWYYWSRGPLSREDVERYVSVLEKRAGGPNPATKSATDNVREFALRDDGKQFFMCNLVKYRDKPQYKDGDRGRTSREANLRYVRNTMPMLLSRACHPYGLFRPIINLKRADSCWDEIGIVRYRSRRDFLNMVTSEKWHAGYGDKQAALSDNPNMPSRAFVAFPIVPILMFAILLIIGVIGTICIYFRP
jgi:hypothetical protein